MSETEIPAPENHLRAHPMGTREAARQEAVALIHRAGLEMEEEYDLLVDDLTETMVRFAATEGSGDAS